MAGRHAKVQGQPPPHPPFSTEPPTGLSFLIISPPPQDRHPSRQASVPLFPRAPLATPCRSGGVAAAPSPPPLPPPPLHLPMQHCAQGVAPPQLRRLLFQLAACLEPAPFLPIHTLIALCRAGGAVCLEPAPFFPIHTLVAPCTTGGAACLEPAPFFPSTLLSHRVERVAPPQLHRGLLALRRRRRRHEHGRRLDVFTVGVRRQWAVVAKRTPARRR
eukprot:264309-Chlamydomonas_euryale.AAC.4